MINIILNRISGTVSAETLNKLYFIIQQNSPEVIVDLYGGEGRTALLAAIALKRLELPGKVYAIENHITDSKNPRGLMEGTILKFLQHIITFGVQNTLIPILSFPINTRYLFNKKSIDLLIMPYNTNTLASVIEFIPKVRAKGSIVLIMDNENDPLDLLNRFKNSQITGNLIIINANTN